jgi:hypothetical protein
MVTRQATPATRIEVQAGGTAPIVEVPGQYVASYAFGGLEPLDLEVARVASLTQYRIARTCFAKFTTVLKSNADTLPRADA